MLSKLVLFIAGTVVVSAASVGESCTTSIECVSTRSNKFASFNRGMFMKGDDEGRLCCGSNIFDLEDSNTICIPKMLTKVQKYGKYPVSCIDLVEDDDEMDKRTMCVDDSDCVTEDSTNSRK